MQSKLKQGAGAIAQSVEQRTENPCVPGSIPGGTTFNAVSQLLTKFTYKTTYKSDKLVSFL